MCNWSPSLRVRWTLARARSMPLARRPSSRTSCVGWLLGYMPDCWPWPEASCRSGREGEGGSATIARTPLVHSPAVAELSPLALAQVGGNRFWGPSSPRTIACVHVCCSGIRGGVWRRYSCYRAGEAIRAGRLPRFTSGRLAMLSPLPGDC